MTDSGVQRELGRMESQIETLVDEVTALRREVAVLNNRFATLDGGRKALWALLTAAGVLGGLIVTLAQYFWPR